MIVDLALLAIMAIIAFAVVREGCWRGMVLFLATLVAATIATAWYEPLAAAIEKLSSAYAQLADIAALWLIFLSLLGTFYALLHRFSPEKVAFMLPVEIVGTGILALATAWTFGEFTAATLHTAPLRADAVPALAAGKMLFGMKPDVRWLNWVRGSTKAGAGPFADPAKPFDPAGDFVERYRTRIAELSGGRPAGQ